MSHDLGSIAKYCDRVLLLGNGEVQAVGAPGEVIDVYRRSENRRALGSRVVDVPVPAAARGQDLADAQAGGGTLPSTTRGESGAVATVEPEVRPRSNPIVEEFHADHFIRHNQRRLEHLASLGLDLAGRTVLEVGAGIGDHTSFFLDRDCWLTATDLREENLDVLRGRYPEIRVGQLDLDDPDPYLDIDAEVVVCYGTLYHLQRPAEALAFLAGCCSSLLLLETAVSPGDDADLAFVPEPVGMSIGASGIGNRPTRRWVRDRLAEHFENVYVPLTQPAHDEFPLDWHAELPFGIGRAVFVASREPLDNPMLTKDLPIRQFRR